MKNILSYKLLRSLDQGGQSSVFQVKKGEKLYALKLFPVRLGREADREAKVLSMVRHPAVAAFVESGFFGDQPFLVTEWIEGISLEEAPPPEEWETLRSQVLQILRGLEAFHRQGWVHGDVKGANILLNGSEAKLVDLGLAQSMQESSAAPAGSLVYLAPELLFGHAPSPASDLYALGMTLFRWLSGHFPFSIASPSAVIRGHLFETPLQPQSRAGIPAELSDFVLCLLAKSPDDRPKDVTAALARFCGLFGMDSVEEPEEETESTGFELYGAAISHYEAKIQLDDRESLLLAELYYRQGHLEKAHRTLEGKKNAEARLLRGQVLTRMGNFSAASAEFGDIVDSEAELSPVQQLSLLNSRGVLHYYRGEIPMAEDAFRAAETWARREGGVAALGVAYNNLGNILLERGEGEKAESAYRRALELSREAGDRIHEGMYEMSLGYFFHRSGRPKEAWDAYGKSLSILENLGQKNEAGRVRLNRANLALSLGEIDSAKVDLSKAQRVFGARNSSYLLTYSRQIEGEVLRKEGRLLDAAKIFAACRRELEVLGRPSDASWARLHEAECLLETKSPDAASLLVTSPETDPSDSRWRGHWHFLKGRSAWLNGQGEPDVLGNFSESEKLLQEAGDDDALILLNYAWGGYLHRAGRQDEAIRRLRAALKALQDASAQLPTDWRKLYLQRSPAREIERMLSNMESFSLPRGESETGDEFFENALRQLQKELLGEMDLSVLAEKILDRMIDLTQAERGFILLREEPAPRIAVSRNMEPSKARKSEEQISWSIAAEVLEKGRPLVTVDAMTDSRFSVTASVHALKLRSILCLPLKSGAEIIGAIYLDSREKRGRFQPSLTAALSPFAELLGQVLANARRFFEVQSDLKQVKRKLDAAQSELKIKYDYRNIVGRHPRMLEIFKVLDRVTDVEVSVLILGESGVGKERIAKAVHFNGPRAERPFVSLNCQAIPEGLFESELFGHVRGAFTGAVSDRIGLVEQAHRGTLFLDEIGDMPLTLQGKLLRVLQEGKFRPVGAKLEKPVDCRVLAATHQDLRAMIRKGKFREDLWFRLNVVEIQVPPLRERMEDLPLLAGHFLAEYARRHGGKPKKLTAAALTLLARYIWPGNVRELENTLTNACVFAEAEALTPQAFRYKRELFGDSEAGKHEEHEASPETGLSFREACHDFEKKLIRRALKDSRGNITHAALQLKIARPQLSVLLKKYQIAMS